MSPEDHPRDPDTPDVNSVDAENLTDAELDALEDAEDVRISLERLKTEDSVSWDSIKAKHALESS